MKIEVDVTVVIPTIPPRGDQLSRALRTVSAQRVQPADVIVEYDHGKTGAAATRNRAIKKVQTKWVAFLDDDDEFYSAHLQWLLEIAEDENADLVYPWFDLVGGQDPLAVPLNGELVNPLGVPFGEEQKQYILNVGNFIPVTHLCRTELVRDVGGFPIPGSEEWPHETNEDWGFLQNMLKQDAKFVHLPERTWIWNWWHQTNGVVGNTSGSPKRW